LIIYKIVAVTLDVKAIGQLGQFISLMSIIMILSTAGINNGVTKLVAESKHDNEKLIATIQTAFYIISIFSILLIGLLFIFSELIFTKLFYLDNIEPWFKYFFISSILLIASSQFFLSIINGFKNTKIYSFTISVGSIISILFAYPLIQSYGLYGAFTTLIINYIAQSLYLFLLFKKTNIFKKEFFKYQYSSDILAKYINYALMFIVSALTIPIVHIIIRNMVGDSFSETDVGYWEALMKMSNLYVTFIGVFLSVYYLPHLSDKSDREIIVEVHKFFKILFSFLLVIFSFIYIFKIYIIQILFSDKFLIVTDYIYIQQIGDFFKLLSFIFGYIIIIKMWTKTYIIFEIFHSIIFILLGNYFIYNTNGFYGASIAYSITYFIHFVINISIFYNFRKKVLA
jgi:PST family polysaccharide transporter